MPSPSLARTFFEEIVNSPDPIAAIQGLVKSVPPTFEPDWLDFKQQPTPDLKNPKWREMWAQALGGFPNNQGGVIVWGVDARKDLTTNIDAACDLKPVDNPNGVKSRLIELQRHATDPPLANVEIEAYELPSAPGMGFVVCFVPEGPYKPYRTEDGRRSQYYLRAGDSFVVMSRSVLGTMFFPRARAVFRARGRLEWEQLDNQAMESRHLVPLVCTIELVNDGTATARNPLVLVQPSVEGNLAPLAFSSDNWTSYSTPSGLEFEAGRPLHPGRVTPLFKVKWELGPRSKGDWENRFFQPPSFTLAVFCENQERQVIEVRFDMEKLVANGKSFCEATPVE